MARNTTFMIRLMSLNFVATLYLELIESGKL